MTSTTNGGVARWPAPDGLRATDPDATAILGRHRPDPWGICLGCEEQFALLVRHPCAHAHWAERVERRTPTQATLAVAGMPPAQLAAAQPAALARAV